MARFPIDLPYPAADWWRALLVTGYMTGWRISELLALKREDLDLEAGTAITRAKDNKGNRDERVQLHPVVIDHLNRIASFDPFVFPWMHYKTTFYKEFGAIQEKAEIKLDPRRSRGKTQDAGPGIAGSERLPGSELPRDQDGARGKGYPKMVLLLDV